MALGRGLSELLGEIGNAYENSTTTSNNIDTIDIDLIKLNPAQPRKIFDENKLKQLSSSILKHGLLQPICVIKSIDKDGYILVSGERRLRAHKLADLKTIKSSILEVKEDKLRQLALIENIQRDDLNIIELAISYSQLIVEHKLTHEELSKLVFKSRSSITNTLRLLNLDKNVQNLVMNDQISAGHAKILIGLSNEDQLKISNSIIGQQLSVRATENMIKDLKKDIDNKKIKNSNKTGKLNFESLNTILKTFKSRGLKVKLNNDTLNIHFQSQEDINNITKLFS